MASEYNFLRYSHFGDGIEYVTDKEKSIKAYKGYMLNRLTRMFTYKNLPDTIPQEIFESMLLTNGTCFVTEVDSQLYAFIGSYGGEPDPYYRPTRYIVANPALKLSANYKIDEDGVLVRNDVLWMGLDPLMSRYATMLAENFITLRVADIMLRVVALLTAPDDRTKAAAEAYLNKITDGELGVIAENRFLDGIKMQSPPSNNGSYLTQFIELHQYLNATFYNEIGLNANFNMKREAISATESSLNEDALKPLIETMYECRKADIKRINDMFGTNIEIEFSSAWKENNIEHDLKIAQMAAEVVDSIAEPIDLDSQLTDTEYDFEEEFDESNENNDETSDGVSENEEIEEMKIEESEDEKDESVTKEEVKENLMEAVDKLVDELIEEEVDEQ